VTHAVYPDAEGYLDRLGVRIWYEAYGDGPVTILLYPPWEITHSRVWKAQIPYLSRHARVVTFDRRGNGRSDRPADPAACHPGAAIGDALAVLDTIKAERAVLISWCGSGDDLMLAAGHPDRIAGLVLISPDLMLTPDPLEHWPLWNPEAWLQDWAGFAEAFYAKVFTEPHSTKQIEDATGWAMETDAETCAASTRARGPTTGTRPRGPAPRSAVPRWSSRGPRTRWPARTAGRRWPQPSPAPGWSPSRVRVTARTCATRCGPT